MLHEYKSIRECDMELRNLNVLVGPNGAGKSNLLGFFSMMRRLAEGGLQDRIDEQGDSGALLHRGAASEAALEGLSAEKREDEMMEAMLTHMVCTCTPDRREVRYRESPPGRLSAELHFGGSGYRFALELTRDGRLKRWFEEFTLGEFGGRIRLAAQRCTSRCYDFCKE